MNDELYQMKYKYERLIRNLDEALVKLESSYSNLILCKKKIANCFVIDNNYYNYQKYEKIISDMDNYVKTIKNIILPQVRYEYNEILLKISTL